MPSYSSAKRLAVLIDAENVPPSFADPIFRAVQELGCAETRRVYGDFSSPRMSGWSALLNTHALQPRQTSPKAAGKNAADIAMVIDAMDLLHSGGFEGFCLTSCDSDFSPLALRIREHGPQVFGLGWKQAPTSLRHACNRFIDLDEPEPSAAAKQVAPPAVPASVRKTIVALARQAATETGWADSSVLGQLLRREEPSIAPKRFGASSLSALLKRTGCFEFGRSAKGAMIVRVRS